MMKTACLSCERTAPGKNLFCQEVYCQAEQSPPILEFGEWLGDIEITRLISVLPTSTLYEARHNKRNVLLKVAHPGDHHKHRLEREARFLADLTQTKATEPTLPQLLPPYTNTSIADDPYGKVMLKGHLLYYYVFKHVEGSSLRDVMSKNSQLWIDTTQSIIASLADAIAVLHSKGFVHCAICPEAVLVRLNDDTSRPQIVLADLGIISKHQLVASVWYADVVAPAYTAPELIRAAPLQANYATDVYGLGLVLYELLVGQPVFPVRPISKDDIYDAVLKSQRVYMSRDADVAKVAALALRATNIVPTERFPDAQHLHQALTYPHDSMRRALPRATFLTPRAALLLLAGLIVVAFLVTIGVNIALFASAAS